MEDSLTIVLDSKDLLSGVCGANDGKLRVIEGSLGGRIAARGNEIRLEGVDEASLRRFKTTMDQLISAVREGDNPSPEYVRALVGECSAGESPETGTSIFPDSPLNDTMIRIPHGFNRVFPRGANQGAYVRGMRSCDISFGIGPAGTGKTFLAIAEALRLVLSKAMRKMLLTRPVVEAGENLGFLPGDLTQKINPYLRPLYDAMESLVPYEVIRRLEETRAI